MDANSFASLALLNRQWRRTSDSPALYAYHLSRCLSFAWARGVIPTPGDSDSLPDLKRLFIAEIRRNAFDVLLRPRRTLVRLISSSMSSSTPFPQGEVFRFAFSANGQMVLGISSSRIVVLEVAADPVAVKHELQPRRRPMGATIQDDGSLLAVLSSTHRVHIYGLSSDEAKHIQTITLNNAPRDLTFSPTGSVLALAFEDNIEVFAVGEGAMSTERRAARCSRVDTLSFSSDGSMLLGSPVVGADGSIVTITAPFYTETGTDASPEEVQMRMWTTQILFPEVAQGFTHACLIGSHEAADDSWILGYDSQLAAFRAIKTNNVNAGSVYFASPFLAREPQEMLPVMLPTTDEAGELAAFGFQNSEVWIYGVPGRLNVAPANSTSEAQEVTRTRLGGDHHYVGQTAPRDNLARLERIVQNPKVLIRGRHVTDMQGITSARWVRSTQPAKPRRRLVAVAPGGVRPQAFGGEDVPVDGGRLLLLDFERSSTNGEEIELDIEIGETVPKMLMEPDSSLDTEVELERRRTRLQRPDTESAIGTRGHRQPRPPPRGSQRRTSQTLLPHLRRNSAALPTSADAVTPGDVPDIPYDNTQPRSHETLRRAATAAASTRGRYDPRYRNSPSRRLIPHESVVDNWVPPPPPYTRDPDRPLPDHLWQTLLPRATAGPQNLGNASTEVVQRAQTTRIARPITQDRPRPQSAVFQRLGTIAGVRRTGRGRKDSTAATREELIGDQTNAPGTTVTPIAQAPYQGLSTIGPTQANHWPPHTNTNTTATPIVPVANGHLPSVQPLPTLAIQPAEELSQQPTMLMPQLGATMLGEIYLDYSVSSPNLLHIPQPHGNALDLAVEDEDQIPARQRSFRRRVSTEPNSLPPSENEEWRRRIKDWNEHTIRERSRKRRSKCVVM